MISRKHKSKSREGGVASSAVRGAGNLLMLPLAAAAGWIAYSTLGVDHDMPLPSAIEAERRSFSGQGTGRLNAYVDRQAGERPLALIHSINAAASAYEMRPLFERYRGRRPVWALDLPGFGFSERADRVYTPELYQDAILGLLGTQIGEAADVVALSLGCEFAARAALARPELFHSLTLISPTGFAPRGAGASSQRAGESGSSDLVYQILSFPVWSQALFDLIVTRRSIHFFLQQSFVRPVDKGLADYAYLTAHQPGARHAPLYFLSGQLFTPRVRDQVYAQLDVPVLVLYDRDAFTRFDMLPALLEERSNWRAVRIRPTLGLPHFDKPEDTAHALDTFWQTLD
jgi:pimeloyl-ACP methyl ester carboxylesterase